MILAFFHSFESEWLKTRRSLATLLVVAGGFFIPLLMLIGRLVYAERYQKDLLSPRFWEQLMSQSWQFMAILLLPMGVILATSLITQLEFRNNTWKQLHTTPQAFGVIFWAKLSVILLMLLQFFGLFNVGMYLSGVVPALLQGVALPTQAFPFKYFLTTSGYFLLDCLPIVGLQYLISLQFRNFLIPLGVGIGVLLASLVAAEWQYGYTIPYTYCLYNFFSLRGADLSASKMGNIHFWAMGYFVGFIGLGFVLYLFKREKG
jgi:lantibiotic transport system permease protein